MATMVYLEKEGNCLRCVGNEDAVLFLLSYDGYVLIEPWTVMFFDEIAEFVLGCFEENSNFERVIRENFEFKGEFKGIAFRYDKNYFKVTKEDANYKTVVEEYCQRFIEE